MGRRLSTVSQEQHCAPEVLSRIAELEADNARLRKKLVALGERAGLTSDDGNSTVRQRRRVAILGGAFDPITNSHLTCAAEIVRSGKAEEVWLVPCARRPDKPKLQTPIIDRYCMCQIAINTAFAPGFPVKVSDIEVFLPEAAYTYDLLQGL